MAFFSQEIFSLANLNFICCGPTNFKIIQSSLSIEFRKKILVKCKNILIFYFYSGPTTFKVIVSNIPIEAEKDELEVLIKEFDTMEIANSGESQTVTVTYQTKEHADK